MDKEHFNKYYLESREDIFLLVPPGAGKILDVGCGGGALGKKLKKRGVEYIAGIESDPGAAWIARQNLDMVIEGDAEKIILPFEEGYFDCIILADILEHLKDPWKLLTVLRPFLSSGGLLVLSIPNARHYSIVKRLLFGKWTDEEDGLFDRTHLHFFTLESIGLMLEHAGYRIASVERQIREGRKLRLANALFFNLLTEHLTFRYLVTARKQDDGPAR